MINLDGSQDEGGGQILRTFAIAEVSLRYYPHEFSSQLRQQVSKIHLIPLLYVLKLVKLHSVKLFSRLVL